MISKKEVQRIAHLARLKLTEKELIGYQQDFSSILDYIGSLAEIETEVAGFEPTRHPLLTDNVTRKDEDKKTDGRELISSDLLNEKGYLKVKSILK